MDRPAQFARSQTVGRSSLSEDVAQYVRELILTGQIRPGEFVRTEQVAAEQGVSVTPVRDALGSLAHEGFLTSVPRRGYRVTAFTRQDVRDLFWAQSELAGELAARFTPRARDSDLALLESLMVQCDDAVARGDAEASGRLGHRFHRHINLAADSPRLAQMLASMVTQLPDRFYTSIEANVVGAPQEHHAIFDAIAAGDAEGARAASIAHIIAHADHAIEILEAGGMWRGEAE